MDLFSYRQKIKKNPEAYQLESMSLELRNRLWTCLYNAYFSEMFFSGFSNGHIYYHHPENRQLCELIWHNFFKKPIDCLSSSGKDALIVIRKYFFEEAGWFEIYDFIEFCAENSEYSKDFNDCINQVLKEEFVGYRFIDGIFVQITDEKEIEEIANALSINNEISEHLQTALKYLSDKKSPDYRNSIKESISAVETLCKKIVNKSTVTLGEALNIIEKSGKIQFHGAEKSAFSSLYGWTSVDGGIRHGMMDASNLDQEDAKLMLISCSAFINYLKVKADKANIKIQ